MNTIMIVDDERPARELLKMAIDWNSAGFEIIYEARNGKEALDFCLQNTVDLIITDIQMPLMDGLELIEAVRWIFTDQKFIILSCHESFDFAKRALRLNVIDYLIKDTLSAETLTSALRSAFKEKTDIFAAMEDNTPRRGELLMDILQETATQKQITDIVGEKLNDKCEYFCFTIRPEDTSRLSSEQMVMLCSKLRALLSEFKADVCLWHTGVLFLLVYLPRPYSKSELLNKQVGIVEQVRTYIEEQSGIAVTIGVSLSESRPDMLGDVVRQAAQAMDTRIYFGKGKTHYYNKNISRAQSIQVEDLNAKITNVITSAKDCDYTAVKDGISGLYNKAFGGMMQYHYLQHINAVLLGGITTQCLELNIPYKAVFQSDTVPLPDVENFETVSEMYNQFLLWFERLIEASNKQQIEEKSPRLNRILQYVSEYYAKDIGLETIAEDFGLHKVYLAKIFKSETGKSVNEYIRNLRIEKAKELLSEEDVKISEIIGLVGFNNPQSFYSVFRQVTGVSPGKYRELKMINKNISRHNKEKMTESISD